MSILCTRPASLMGVSRARTATDRTHPQRHLSIHPSTRASHAMPCLYCNDQPTPRVHPHLHSLVFALPRACSSAPSPVPGNTHARHYDAKASEDPTRSDTSQLAIYGGTRGGAKNTTTPPPPRSISQAPKIEHGRHAQGKRWGTGPILASQRSRKTIEAASRAVGWIRR